MPAPPSTPPARVSAPYALPCATLRGGQSRGQRRSMPLPHIPTTPTISEKTRLFLLSWYLYFLIRLLKQPHGYKDNIKSTNCMGHIGHKHRTKNAKPRFPRKTTAQNSTSKFPRKRFWIHRAMIRDWFSKRDSLSVRPANKTAVTTAAQLSTSPNGTDRKRTHPTPLSKSRKRPPAPTRNSAGKRRGTTR